MPAYSWIAPSMLCTTAVDATARRPVPYTSVRPRRRDADDGRLTVLARRVAPGRARPPPPGGPPRAEPVVLDLLDRQPVAEEAVDAERDPVVLDGVAPGEEAAEDEQ